MTEQMIEVKGLPEGWSIEKINICTPDYVTDTQMTWIANAFLVKIQPRRIVLEEISKEEYHRLFHDERCTEIYNLQRSYWKQVKETDIPLTNEDPHLKLTKKDMLELIEHIKLGGKLNHKIAEFIDYYQPEPKLGLSVAEVKTIFGCDFELLVKVDKFIKENS